MTVVLRDTGGWLIFRNPEEVLQTAIPDEVQPLLRQAASSGRHAAGFVAYEAAPAFDSALQTHPNDGFPLLCLGLYQPPERVKCLPNAAGALYERGALETSVSREEFQQVVGRIKEQIAAGTTYQVNYTYQLTASFNGSAFAFFRALVAGQHIQHAAFVETDDWSICSASPEMFFRLEQGRIVSRPMKGTTRRGRTPTEDHAQAQALFESEKNRAENIMVVDMVRNDIGRIAKTGSVETLSRFNLEKYPTLWQMTSTVTGTTPCSNVEVLEALFPCASITGAPKAKAMELIRGLETSPRRIYTGCIGGLTPAGDACFNVAIRTVLIDRAAGRLAYGVGGGIVWDSDANEEYEETLTKARVLTAARPPFDLLETLLYEPETGIFLLDRHLKRLARSAAYFDMPFDHLATRRMLVNAGSGRLALRLRLTLARNGTLRLEQHPLNAIGDGKPLTVKLAQSPVYSNNLFVFHKTTHRTAYERARQGLPDCDEVLLWNERGEVTEGTAFNVVVRRGDQLVTPPVRCGLLGGVFREELLERGELVEDVVTVGELCAANEVFLINSVRRWRQATLK